MSVSFTGITPNNAPTNQRAVLDANYIVNVALPNAANATNTNALDLRNNTPFPTTETINVQILMAASNGANSKNLNCVLQETTANTDGTPNSAAWANASGLANPLITSADNAGGGRAASNVIFKLQPGGKRFIRAQFRGEANGGDASGANGTLQLLF